MVFLKSKSIIECGILKSEFPLGQPSTGYTSRINEVRSCIVYNVILTMCMLSILSLLYTETNAGTALSCAARPRQTIRTHAGVYRLEIISGDMRREMHASFSISYAICHASFEAIQSSLIACACKVHVKSTALYSQVASSADIYSAIQLYSTLATYSVVPKSNGKNNTLRKLVLIFPRKIFAIITQNFVWEDQNQKECYIFYKVARMLQHPQILRPHVH